MEDLFSTVVVLIPLAIFIAIRMSAAKKKKDQEEDRKKIADMLFHSAGSPSRRIERDEDEEFDAHSLEPDDEENAAAAAAKEQTPPPVRYRSLVAEMPAAPAHAAAQVSHPAEATHAASVAGGKPHAKEPAAAAGSAFAFPSRVESLPPLKKAVILSELLNGPKGW